ncbi:hypothetical protein [Methylosarcina fibrata]|uniref:hypothetical protein n=1 Tax=Methylosarcina fibrata TaxID=105972 RepID=UPI0003773C0B|nr:hypothetical protein [Methylosarcina fibrata]
MSDTSWSYGWTFFKTGRTGMPPADIEAAELTDWLKGFCAAMADYGLDGEHPSIQAALLHYGIDGDLLEECLKAAEIIIDVNEFNRWPSVPVRGFGAGNLRSWPFVMVLPDAANDES